ncbi:MAG: cytochrome c [bacterium]|nr:MAG: cytochrome c [bacterium]
MHRVAAGGRKGLPVAILLFVAAAAWAFPAPAAPDGESLFASNCSPCHGAKAVGEDPQNNVGGGWREDGSMIAPALNGTAHAWHHGPDLLFRYVRDGSVDPHSPMPAFGDRLTEDEIWSIIRYFQSLWPDRTRALYEQNYPGGLGSAH